MAEMLPDDEAAKAILKDADAADAQMEQAARDAYEKYRATAAELKKVLLPATTG